MAKDKAAREANQQAEEQFAWNQEQARKAEIEALREKRRGDIAARRQSEAAQLVNKMFQGGSFSAQAEAKPMKGQFYYDQNGNQVQYSKPVYFKGPKRKGQLKKGVDGPVYLNKPGTVDFGTGWDDPAFYDQRARAYEANYLPQIQQQFADAETQRRYALANAGLSRSSANDMTGAKLLRDKDVQVGNVKLKGQAVANQLRDQVAGIRTSLLSNIQNNEDPNSAVATATSQLNNVRATPVKYDALGDLFSGIAAGIGGYQNGANYGASGGGYNSDGRMGNGTGKRVG